jgi:hypothetical protein
MSDRSERHCSPGRASHLTVLLVILAMALAGCRAVNPLSGFGFVKSTPEENRIRKLMKWHSGRVEVYKDFQTIFTARAVYISDEIRQAAVDWEARSRLMNPDEKDDLYGNTFRGDPDVVQILLGFYTPDEDLNDLDETESVWIPYLKNPDGTVTRATCFGVGSEEGRIYMRFLEWDLSWSRLYLLCFPKASSSHVHGDGWINLVISGPKGQGEVRLRAIQPPQ